MFTGKIKYKQGKLVARSVCIATRTRSPTSTLARQKWRLALRAPPAIRARKHSMASGRELPSRGRDDCGFL
jgi:hypothetical protein